MSKPDHADVTRLLHQWQEGDASVLDHLMPLLYDELRRLAHHYLQHERAGHTLNTTALVHEAFLNLAGGVQIPWQNRAHFFAIAARAMRQVLIWYARKRNRAKRGGGKPNLPLDKVPVFAEDRLEELLALEQALQQLEAMDARLCRVVECRYYAGLSIPETAEALGIAPATVKRDWRAARTWLHRTLHYGS